MKKQDYTSPSFWKPFGRVSIFIDAANVFYSQRSLGWSFDFKKFYPFFNLVCANLLVRLSTLHFGLRRKVIKEIGTKS